MATTYGTERVVGVDTSPVGKPYLLSPKQERFLAIVKTNPSGCLSRLREQFSKLPIYSRVPDGVDPFQTGEIRRAFLHKTGADRLPAVYIELGEAGVRLTIPTTFQNAGIFLNEANPIFPDNILRNFAQAEKDRFVTIDIRKEDSGKISFWAKSQTVDTAHRLSCYGSKKMAPEVFAYIIWNLSSPSDYLQTPEEESQNQVGPDDKFKKLVSMLASQIEQRRANVPEVARTFFIKNDQFPTVTLTDDESATPTKEARLNIPGLEQAFYLSSNGINFSIEFFSSHEQIENLLAISGKSQIDKQDLVRCFNCNNPSIKVQIRAGYSSGNFAEIREFYADGKPCNWFFMSPEVFSTIFWSLVPPPQHS